MTSSSPRALGFNGARKHQKVEDPRYLRPRPTRWACWSGPSCPAPTGTTRDAAGPPSLVSRPRGRSRRHRGHPSVVALGADQRVVGAAGWRWARPPPSAARVDPVARRAGGSPWTGTRPVLGQRRLGDHGRTTPRHPRLPPRDPALLTPRATGPRRALEDRRSPPTRPYGPGSSTLDGAGVAAGRAPLLSEFGGVALRRRREHGGTTPCPTPEALVQRVARPWPPGGKCATAPRSRVACWTQLTDTYQEVNGVVDMARQPKMPVDAVRKATRGR